MTAKQRISRSPLFDASYYRAAYPDAAESGDPIEHYLAAGAARDYNPHPLFDSARYRARHAHVMAANITPLEHYLTEGRLLAPCILFDPEHYVRNTPGAAAAKVPLLQHYLETWKAHPCSPHPLFDVRYYLERYPDAASSGLDPLTHYILAGHDAGHAPHPLFDTDFYYRRNPDVKAAGLNALAHYIEVGGFERRDPNPWFSSSYYLEHNPDVAAARMNPLVHYVLAGAAEDRSPHPLFRGPHWRAVRGIATKGPDALADFLSAVQQPGAHGLATLAIRPRNRCRPDALEGSPGVNLVGWPRMENGVAEQMREMARSLDAAGVGISVRDVSYMSLSDPGDDSIVHWQRPDSPFSANLFMINADNMADACLRLGFESVAHRFNIGSWHWELAEFPDAWQNEFAVLDELWCSSTFIQKSVSLKADVPVLYVPPAVTLPKPAPIGRSYFGIPHDRFVFMFQFDFTGFMNRKNPYAALAAFRSAFPSGREPVALVIKTNSSARYPERVRELLDAVGQDPRVVILQDTLRRDQVVSLLSMADAFVSLHRAEGFGRSLAESMLLGKPVIGTNYSGNTDFMTPANSCPVHYTLIPVAPGEYPFAEGQVWADPDVEQASWYMRRLLQNRDYRELIGSAARATMEQHYSPEATGLRCARRLRALGLVEPPGATWSKAAAVGH